MAKGHLLEAQHKDADAVEAFVEGAKLAGDLDLAPTMAAVKKLVDLNQQARVAELLAPLEAKADGDPQLSLTLGNGYLQAGISDKAETWLRKASDARPTDPDAMYQLAKAMAKNGKTEDAVAQLKRAMDIDPSRLEFGLELARTYEDAGRDADAGALYDKLLTAKDAGLELRARAGKFFARTGAMEKAAAQGAEILKADPNHPAGLYLKGEGLLALGHGDEARKAFHAADTVDRDPQYFDAEGRAAEKIILDTGDTKWVDVALNVYNLAHLAAPKMFNPLAGTGRLYYGHREWKKAADALNEAWKIKEDGDVAFMLGVCAQELLDNAVAKQWLAKAQRLKSIPEASNRLGLLYKEANEPKEAIVAFRLATSGIEDVIKKTGVKSPAWLMEAYYQLGDLLFQTASQNPAQWHEARVAFDKWVALGPPHDNRYDRVDERLKTSLRGK
jgi:tetratricopeptide (TPR) repeat protein